MGKKITMKMFEEFLTWLTKGNKIDGFYVEEASPEEENLLFTEELDDNKYIEIGSGKWKDIYYDVKAGVSKVCFWFSGYDEVVKVPVKGTYWYDPNREENIKVWELTSNFIEEEIEAYERSSQAVKDFLIPNTKIGEINNIPVYTQKVIDFTFGEYEDNTDKEVFKQTLEEMKQTDFDKEVGEEILNVEFRYDMYKAYPNYKEILTELEKWAYDLHANNIGYTKDRKPVCFDYAQSEYEDKILQL